MLANTSFTAKNFVKPLYTCPTGKKAIVTATVLNKSGKEADLCLGVAPSSVAVSEYLNNDAPYEVLENPSGVFTDYFGYSSNNQYPSNTLSKDGDYIAVGAYSYDDTASGFTNSGAVYIYKMVEGSATKKTLIQTIKGTVGSTNRFGSSIAMASGYLYILEETGTTGVYKRNDTTGLYSRITGITNSGLTTVYNIAANSLGVFIQGKNSSNYHVVVFSKRTGDTFSTTSSVYTSEMINAFNGGSIVCNEQTVVFANPTASTNKGEVYISYYNGTTFTAASILGFPATAQAYFGYTLGLNSTGDLVVGGTAIGSSLYNDFFIYKNGSHTGVFFDSLSGVNFNPLVVSAEHVITSTQNGFLRVFDFSGRLVQEYSLAGTKVGGNMFVLGNLIVLGNQKTTTGSEAFTVLDYTKPITDEVNLLSSNTVDMVTLPINSTFERTGIELKAGETVFVTSSQDDIGNIQSHNAFVFGIEESV